MTTLTASSLVASIILVAGLPACAQAPAGGAKEAGSSPPAAASTNALVGSARAASPASPAAAMLRFPAVGPTHICFSYANDLWLVPRAGGVATPLASPPGLESLPRFSPDGKTIAFVGNYDGNRDIYTLPVTGGVPFRVTHHPAAESLAGWSPDGQKLLFFTSAMQGIARQTRLFTVPATGGMPEPLPMPYAAFGSFSPDGSKIAYNPLSIDTRTWKRYRGGMAPDVWIFDLNANTAKQITDWEGTDTLPMWHGDSIYYLSDQGPEHRLNIWKHDTGSGKHTQVTTFKDDDVRWPSLGPGDNAEGEIVFQLGAEMRLLNLTTAQSRAVSVEIPGARASIRPRTVDASRHIQGYDLSPTGKRVALAARGEIWSAPAKEGTVRNLTRTQGVNERSPAWSPDGRWIAYFSDATGEYELYVRPSDAKEPEAKKDDKKDEGTGDEKPEAAKGAPDSKAEPKAEPRKLTSLGEGFRFNPTWSPDSKRIAFTDMANRLWLTSVESGETKEVVRDENDQMPTFSWSSDSNWIALTLSDNPTRNAAVWLYDVRTGEKTRVTDPMFPSGSPAFDREGEFLYYITTRSVDSPLYSPLDGSFVYAGLDTIVALPLRKDVKNPYAPKSDEEEYKKDEKKPAKDDAKKDEGKKDDAKKDEPKGDEAAKGDGEKASEDKGEKKPEKKSDKKDEKKDKKKEVKIDLAGAEARAITLPIAKGDFGALTVSHDGKLVYVRRERFQNPDDDEPSGGGIKLFDPKPKDDEKKAKEELIVAANGYSMSGDGKKLAVMKDGGVSVLEVAAGGGKATKAPTAGAMQLTIDPRTEWKQIFDDAWRLYRDYFYEPTMHGCDWKAIGKHYKDMIDDCSTREDVNWVIAELISELNVGHAYVTGPGEIEGGPSTPVGLLGCDYELDHAAGAYKISRIYAGGVFDYDARSPLASVDVKEGDYLLAVDGVPVDASMDPWAAMIAKAGKPTTITVGAAPALDGTERQVLVKPIDNEGGLRYRAWIEHNRQYVLEKSGGKLAYVHVPDTGLNGQNNLFRQFFGQRFLPGMIIDERWNGGGQLPNRFIELLNRPVTNAWAKRYARPEISPFGGHFGPKAMLINGQAGSGGDCFPAYFRIAKLGPIIGKRTWGGLVGIGGKPPFVDGGSVSVPEFAFFKLNGTWGIEGHGVDPDIDVTDDPAKMLTGGDPQLDAAIDALLKELAKNPPPSIEHNPPGPNRSGMGIDPKDK